MELLNEINTKRSRISFWPFVLVGGVLLGMVAAQADTPQWGIAALWVIVAGLCFFTYHRDLLRKTVVLMYDFDEEAATKYESLHRAFEQMAQCAKSWHIEAKGTVADWKRNAGASGVAKRTAIRLVKANPPRIKTNITVPVIPVGRQMLYMFPDRIFVFDQGTAGSVGYDQLRLQSYPQRFIEEDGVPGDSKIVDYTWRYVNKKGGPDKRFKNNRQIPIALYEQVHFSSDTGLNEIVMLSRTGASAGLATLLDDWRHTPIRLAML